MMEPNENARTVLVCQGTGCVSSGSTAIYDAIEAEIKRLALKR